MNATVRPNRPPGGVPASPFPRKGLPAAFLAVLLALAQAGCGGRCAAERDLTAGEMDKATGARADVYAPDTYRKAADLAESADTECRRQEARFFLLRSYSRARDLHREARAEAGKAAREGSVNEGMARQEALNSRYQAAQSVEDARAALVRVRKEKGEGAAEDLADLMMRLRHALAEMQNRIDRGEYLPARDLGNRIVQESIRLQATANRRVLGMPPPPGGMDRLY